MSGGFGGGIRLLHLRPTKSVLPGSSRPLRSESDRSVALQIPSGAKDHHRGTAMQPTRQRLLVCLLRCIAPFSKIVLRLTIFPWLWGPQMQFKPVPISQMDLKRARQIVCSLEALKGLTSDDAEFVARTIAECFAAGRKQGLEIAKGWSDDDLRRAASAGIVGRSATARETSQGECHARDKAARARRS